MASGRFDPRGRARRNGRQDGGRLLHRRRDSGRGAIGDSEGPELLGCWSLRKEPGRNAGGRGRQRFARAALNVTRRNVATGAWFHFHIDRLRVWTHAAALVAVVTRRRYPDLNVPCHQPLATLRGGRRRSQGRVRSRTRRTQRRRYRTRPHRPDRGERPAGRRRRSRPGVLSETRIRAALRALGGFGGRKLSRVHARRVFRPERDDPLRVNAEVLAATDATSLANEFRAERTSVDRARRSRSLLRRLGAALITQRDVFGDRARPGALFDTLHGSTGTRGAAHAPALLEVARRAWADLAHRKRSRRRVPRRCVASSACGRQRHDGGLGSVPQAVAVARLFAARTARMGRYRHVRPRTAHRAAQYRNGGLLLDTGVLQFLDVADSRRTWGVGDEIIVEWRALTVTLLDELAPLCTCTSGRSIDAPRLHSRAARGPPGASSPRTAWR